MTEAFSGLTMKLSVNRGCVCRLQRVLRNIADINNIFNRRNICELTLSIIDIIHFINIISFADALFCYIVFYFISLHLILLYFICVLLYTDWCIAITFYFLTF